MKRRRFGLRALPLVAVVAGCTTPPPVPEPSAPVVQPDQAAARTARKPSRRGDPRLRELLDRPLNVAAQCSFRDADGYRGRLDLAVEEAHVQRFVAEVTTPRDGSCRFDLDAFEQTATHPVTLKNRSGDCHVHIWEQGTQVTVAFGECRSQCAGRARDYLWPILVNTGSGECS